MSGVSSFIASFCIISLTIGALYMLCPKGTMEKGLRHIFVLIILCATLTLIKGIGNVDFNPLKEGYEYDQQQISVLGARLTFEEALRNSHINFTKITVCTDKATDGSIIINEVIVYSTEDSEKIKATIGNQEEYEVTVINE